MSEYIITTPSRAARPPTQDPGTGAVPAARRAELPCESFHPGHHMHPTRWRLAHESPRRPVVGVRVDGFHVELCLDDGTLLRWRHHDPVRLRRVLESVPGVVAVCTEWHALIVGGHWFNCATPKARWQPCSRVGDDRR